MSHRLDNAIRRLNHRGYHVQKSNEGGEYEDHYIELSNKVSMSVSSLEEEYYALCLEQPDGKIAFDTFPTIDKLIDRLDQIQQQAEAKELSDWLGGQDEKVSD